MKPFSVFFSFLKYFVKREQRHRPKIPTKRLISYYQTGAHEITIPATIQITVTVFQVGKTDVV